VAERHDDARERRLSGSNSWGTLGWTFIERPLAEDKLRALLGTPVEEIDAPA